MNGETILWVAAHDWNSLWRGEQQLALRIAAQNRVIYFQPDRATDESALSAIARKLPNLFQLHAQPLHQEFVLVPTPPALPVARKFLPRALLQATTPAIVKINASMLIRQIRRAMTDFKITEPILWLSSPYHCDLVGKFSEKLSCYYVYDEAADFTANIRIRELLLRCDECVSARVNVIFATSRAQCERRTPLNPNTHLVANGVDFELFNGALTSNLPLPADMERIPGPIIGFAGWLGYHIDVHLLREVAEAYPGCSLVLVGPDHLPHSKDAALLRSLSNVFFLGQKDLAELPRYMAAFDVALMPWQLAGHIWSAYPLKLHEYLAAGRAIVATALPELTPFNHLLRIAHTHQEFISCVADSLQDHAPAAVQSRVAAARENTWDHRVADIYRILESLLENRSIGGSESSEWRGDSREPRS